jgi:CUB/sushi domain-containing protein
MALCDDVCVDTRSEPAHCGGCGTACAGPPERGAAACVDSSCAIDCDDGAILDASGTECLGCGSATLAAASPVLYWRLGEPTGSVASDISGNDLHGSYTSVTLGAAGVSSDGDTAIGMTDGRVTLSSIGAFPTTAITAELWMRSSDASTPGTPLSYAAGSDNELLLYDYRSLAIYIDGPSIGTGVALNDGAWHHVAVTWESTTGDTRLYVDGALAFMGTLSAGGVIDPGGTLILGQEQDCVGGCVDPAQRFIGDLDEVAIYDRVLSPDEIAAHYRTVTCGR